MTAGIISTITVLGVTFTFGFHLPQIFAFMFMLYLLLVPVDVFTRWRVEKNNPVDDTRTNFKSYKLRNGLIDKITVSIYMSLGAVAVYFIAGTLGANNGVCSIICITANAIISIFMSMFVLSEFSSIIENTLDYAKITNTKPNPVTILLSKTLGIVYNQLEKKLNNLIKDDDKPTTRQTK